MLWFFLRFECKRCAGRDLNELATVGVVDLVNAVARDHAHVEEPLAERAALGVQANAFDKNREADVGDLERQQIERQPKRVDTLFAAAQQLVDQLEESQRIHASKLNIEENT